MLRPNKAGGRYWKRMKKATQYELARLGFDPAAPSLSRPRFVFKDKSFSAFWNGDALHLDYRVAMPAIGGCRDSLTPNQLMEILAFYAE